VINYKPDQGEMRMILITGATGKVGRELVKLLLDKGAQVRVLVRDEQKVANLGNRVERAVEDLEKPETLAAAMQGIERLYLVTPITQQVANLVAAAKHAGVQYIVKQSTIEAGRSLGPGKWHREQEKLIEDSDMDWTFLRPTMFMSNTIEWWADMIKRQSAVYFPGGKGRVPSVDPCDVATVACAVLTQPEYKGQIYELTGPQALTIHEMVQILARVLGKPIRYTNVPVFVAALWMSRSGMSRRLVKGLIKTLEALRRNEYAYTTDAVERVGGCKPRSFEKWCRDHITAFQ
jgi:uncharacterized protein YbjT (DUF2867 family)